MREAGGVRPRRGRNLKGRCLTFAEREDIAVAMARGESMRSIAARFGRSPSTISREVSRNGDPKGRYRASTAHAAAYERAGRPKPAKLAMNPVLRARVEHDLKRRYSPEQIAGRLRQEYPHDEGMWVSTETIYQFLYVQSRGALRRDLVRCLRTGRALRHPGVSPANARTASPTWSTCPSAPQKPVIAPFRATGKATSSSARGMPPRSAR